MEIYAKTFSVRDRAAGAEVVACVARSRRIHATDGVSVLCARHQALVGVLRSGHVRYLDPASCPGLNVNIMLHPM